MRNYLSSAIAKTGVRNRIEAIRVADDRGWLCARRRRRRAPRRRVRGAPDIGGYGARMRRLARFAVPVAAAVVIAGTVGTLAAAPPRARRGQPHRSRRHRRRRRRCRARPCS